MITLSIILSALNLIPSAQAEISGKTADGCTYTIINGKYLTDCTQKQNDIVTTKQSAPETKTSTAAITSYSNVPVREKNIEQPAAPAPVVAVPVKQLKQNAIVVNRDEQLLREEETREEIRRLRRERFQDNTYLSLGYSSTTIKETNAGSASGLGLGIGTNLDDLLGVEFSYAYSNQNIKIGLAERNPLINKNQTYDSKINSHLFTAETQFHLTPTYRKFRPFLGLGLAYKSSNITETTSNNTATYAGGNSAYQLSQQSLGATASAGTKLRIAKKIQLAGIFRYFFPLSEQKPKLEPISKTSYYQGNASSPSLREEDKKLTSSSQFQILGLVQYIF